jgi:GMP reductase
VEELTKRYPIRYICIDVANGYQVNFEKFVEQVRTAFPKHGLIAGNVCTYEMAERLVHNLGVDIVKLGIGPGSSCTTRIHTGVGNPQLSTIIECADAAHGVNGRVIADGGCRTSGDIAKAFCAGADFVMLGGMLAFHDESEIEADENGMLEFYGMSSDRAMEMHGSRKDGYRSPEGKAISRLSRGPVEYTVQDILGRLGSSCTYIGAKEIREMTIRATFAKVRRTHNTVFGDEL